MSKKKYYVVVRGRQPGIYEQWFGEGGAAEQVEGVADAVFRGFPTLHEAADWLRGLGGETLPGLTPEMYDLLARPPRTPRPGPEALLAAGKVVIYTDGAAIDNPGPGGYGVVLRYGGHRRELSAGYRHTTNNRMELLACIAGLRALKFPCDVVLFSDSRYVVDGMTKGWAARWQAQGWTLRTGEPVKNADLWRQLLRLCDRHRVAFRWVRGHAGDRENERCDRLAMAAARGGDLGVDAAYEQEARGPQVSG